MSLYTPDARSIVADVDSDEQSTLGHAPSPPPYEQIPPRAVSRNIHALWNVLRQVMRDPLVNLFARRMVRAIFIPANGAAMAVVIPIDFAITTQAPFVRVQHEHLFPFVREPAMYADYTVVHNGNEVGIRAFRSTGASLPINRCIHRDGHPENPWRGDVLVMARGTQFFFNHISLRRSSAILLALATTGDTCVTTTVTPNP